VEHLSPTLGPQQSATKFIASTVIKLGTPKVAAQPELLFNKPTSNIRLVMKKLPGTNTFSLAKKNRLITLTYDVSFVKSHLCCGIIS